MRARDLVWKKHQAGIPLTSSERFNLAKFSRISAEDAHNFRILAAAFEAQTSTAHIQQTALIAAWLDGDNK
jgi:hypothetical protein